MNRIFARILVVLAVTLPASGMAQGRDKAEAQAFLMFLRSVAAQRTARTCERGIPDYRQKFDDLYTRWAVKHRARIAQGESAFRELLRNKDQPYTDRSKLEQIEKAIAELAQNPNETSPITLDDHWKAVCEEVLTELSAGLQS